VSATEQSNKDADLLTEDSFIDFRSEPKQIARVCLNFIFRQCSRHYISGGFPSPTLINYLPLCLTTSLPLSFYKNFSATFRRVMSMDKGKHCAKVENAEFNLKKRTKSKVLFAFNT